MLEELRIEADSFSSSLLTRGDPESWNSSNVKLLGLLNEEQEIDTTKLSYLLNMSYAQQQELLRTKNEFLIVFLDENRSYLQVDGRCAIGNPKFINESYDVRLSYVFRDGSGDEMVDDMEDIAQDTNITVDTYRLTAGNVDEKLNEYLLNNHSTYDLSVIDDIEVDNSGSELNQALLENLTKSQHKLLFLAGDLTGANPQSREMIGINFTESSGCGSYPNITIVKTDPLLDFAVNEILEPAECHSVNGTGMTALGRLYKKNPGAGLKDAAIAKWIYGNSTVFYFSHFDAEYLGNDANYQQEIREAIESYLVNCFEVVQVPDEAKNQVVVERLARYDNQLVTMVLYLWEPR